MKSQTWRTSVVLAAMAAVAGCVDAAKGDPNQPVSEQRIDYVAKLNELVKKGDDPNSNAKRFYAKAISLYVEAPAQSDANDICLWPTQLPPERLAERRKWVESNSAALAQLTLGAQRPAYWRQYRGEKVWDAVGALPLAKWRRLIFALQARAEIRAMDGDVTGAVDDITTGYRFGCDMRKRVLLTEQLIGSAIQELSLITAFQTLDYAEMTPDLLQSFQTRLAESSKAAPAFITMTGEKFLVLDSIQSFYGTTAGLSDRDVDAVMDALLVLNRFTVPGERWTREQSRTCFSIAAMMANILTARGFIVTDECSTPSPILVGLSMITRAKMVQLVEKNYAYYDSIVSKTPFQWKEEGIDAVFRTYTREMQNANLLLSCLAPAVDRASYMVARTKVHAEALIAVLGLLRYKIDKGALPSDLQTLVAAGYIPALPSDPFSDSPLVYELSGDSFTLYTRGADCDDDAGQHAPNWGAARRGGDYVFWPVKNPGDSDARGPFGVLPYDER